MTEESGSSVRRVCLVGAGVIGYGWAARCLASGLEVVATDPDPEAERSMRAGVENSWPALERVGLFEGASKDRLSFTTDLEEAVSGADFVQESVPEREELKQSVLAQVDAATDPQTLIASSTSGFLPTTLQARCEHHPERVMVGHPFNPVYLLPLVEVVGGERTSEEAIQRAISFYRSIGMKPLHVKKEIDGHLSDRLQEALWRENLHLIAEGAATPAELDDAIVYGPGLRWALMGVNLTFHMAGGAGGMSHMLDQFGPALEAPWTKLKAPELTEELKERMVAGTAEQAAGRSTAELERRRDEFLIRLLELVREYWPEEETESGDGRA